MDFRLAIGLIAGWVLSTALLPVAGFLGTATPDPLLVLLVICGMEKGIAVGQIAGFLTGILLDLVTTGAPGPTAGIYLVAGHMGGWIGRRFGESRAAAAAAFLPAILILAEVLLHLFLRVAGRDLSFSWSHSFGRIIMTLALAPFLYAARGPLGLGRRVA